LRSLVLPLPQERERTPTPPLTGELFTPYEPPAHHPAHSRLHPQVKAENANTDISNSNTNLQTKVKAEEEDIYRKPDFIKKYDPYDEEENARRALRSDGPTNEPTNLSAVAVKREETPTSADGYQRSHALMRSSAMLGQSRMTPSQQGGGIKIEPDLSPVDSGWPTTDGYQPSNELLESLAMLDQSRITIGQQGSVKTEPDMGDSGYQPSRTLLESFAMLEQSQLNHHHQEVAIKAEPRQEIYPSTFTLKDEPIHSTDRVQIPMPIPAERSPTATSTTTRDPRRRPPNNPPKRVKEEQDEEGHFYGLVKKVKMEKD